MGSEIKHSYVDRNKDGALEFYYNFLICFSNISDQHFLEWENY